MKTLYLYNDVDSWSRQDIIRALEGNSNDVVLHIHSVGGSVIEGNLVCNAIKNYKGNVIGIVDGMAASMATMIFLSCKERKIVSNGFLMIHAPSCGLQGNADELEMMGKVLKSIEEQFKAFLLQNTKFNEAEVNTLMNGKDHWFSAEEALAKGLVHEVISAVDTQAKLAKTQLVASTDFKHFFSNYHLHKNKPMKITSQATQILAKHNIVMDDAEGIIEHLTQLVEKQATQQVELNNKLEAIEKKTTEALIQSAITAKKINESQKALFEKIAKDSGNDSLRMVLDSMVAPMSLTAQIAAAQQGGSPSEVLKTWDEWQEKNPRGLEKMENENPEQFSALYKTKYGVVPQ